jgi:hypothetical protein
MAALAWLKVFSVNVMLALLLSAHATAAEPRNKEASQVVTANVPRGLHETAFALKITTTIADARVRYTVDGSEPIGINGRELSDALSITNTTLMRAAAFKGNVRVSPITTHSYIFLDAVLRQPAAPPGLPAGARAWAGQRSAYEMDSRVLNDPAYRDRIKNSFKSLPIVSIVCPRDDLFGAARGLYLHSTARGDEWERACSAEMILPNGSTAFQIDCGIRIQGNFNRLPAKSPKHSFRLVFREKYGGSTARRSCIIKYFLIRP